MWVSFMVKAGHTSDVLSVDRRDCEVGHFRNKKTRWRRKEDFSNVIGLRQDVIRHHVSTWPKCKLLS